MEIKELKEEILKRYGRYLFGIVDIDVWYDRVEIVSRVEIKKGGRISSHEGTIVVSIDRDEVDTKKCKECLSDIKIGSINYLKIRGDEFKKDNNGRGSEYGLASRLYYMAIDDRYMVDKILDIMSNIHGLRECKGFNVNVHNLL
jgi:hypothetical protein|nr:MAG TPA: hypothetical protein [Bacteriophage sp.]